MSDIVERLRVKMRDYWRRGCSRSCKREGGWHDECPCLEIAQLLAPEARSADTPTCQAGPGKRCLIRDLNCSYPRCKDTPSPSDAREEALREAAKVADMVADGDAVRAGAVAVARTIAADIRALLTPGE